MRIKDLTTESFMSGFRKGYGKPMPSTEKKAAPVQSAASPFSILPPRDAKDILYSVLNGKELDSRQQSLLQKIYNKL
jgi:hypothetical protein